MKKILNSQFSILNSEHGQVILILVLVMTVALAIGISVVQRSLSDISTSTKVEQSSRAFSAAEAGIEKAIQSDSGFASPVPLDNNSTIQGVQKNDIPAINQALEYPPLAKEDLAQVWLVNPSDLTSDQYSGTTLDIYWGLPNITSDRPALEITIIYLSGGTYQSKKFFLDSDSSRISSNGFTDVSASGNCTSNSATTTDTSLGSNRVFLCKKRLDLTELSVLKLLRARILYSSASQPFAVKPTSGSLPVQARLFTATGTSGVTQRKVQVFRLDKVVPPYFDYAIFSSGDINK